MSRPEDLTPLTESQRQLTADNHKLAWAAANRYGWRKARHEEGEDYSDCALELCKSARRWKGERGVRFSTWATIDMKRRMRSRYAAFCARANAMPFCDYQEALPHALAAKEAPCRFTLPDCVLEALVRLEGHEREALALYFGVLGCERLAVIDIAKRFGVGRNAIHSRINKAIRKLRWQLSE